jgi:acetyl-CoA carboxylase carboxyl transferase subunit beta
VVCGTGSIHGIPVAIAVMDFRFCGGAMGSAAGEKITRTIEDALTKRDSLHHLQRLRRRAHAGGHLFPDADGEDERGARQAGPQAGLPYISVLTHPTMGGVTASFATLGDVILAEPGALIGFAGARVIKDTTKQTLPAGFQTAEFLLKHGLVDQIVSRTRCATG